MTWSRTFVVPKDGSLLDVSKETDVSDLPGHYRSQFDVGVNAALALLESEQPNGQVTVGLVGYVTRLADGSSFQNVSITVGLPAEQETVAAAPEPEPAQEVVPENEQVEEQPEELTEVVPETVHPASTPSRNR